MADAAKTRRNVAFCLLAKDQFFPSRFGSLGQGVQFLPCALLLVHRGEPTITAVTEETPREKIIRLRNRMDRLSAEFERAKEQTIVDLVRTANEANAQGELTFREATDLARVSQSTFKGWRHEVEHGAIPRVWPEREPRQDLP